MKKTPFLLLLCSLFFVSAKKQAPSLFMVGDSTMADKKDLTASPERGWGQLFPTYFDEGKMRIENHAANGRSTKSFRAEGRWNAVLERIKPGDAVIIQFGHNDQKREDSTRFSDIAQYRENLRVMVLEVQERHATAILATSVVRRKFDQSGNYQESHTHYPDAVRELAAQMEVPLLDLHKRSVEWIKNTGPEESKWYYMNVEPGKWSAFPNGNEDNTHFQESGALAIGAMAVKEIRQKNIVPLKRCLYKNKKIQIRYSTPITIW